MIHPKWINFNFFIQTVATTFTTQLITREIYIFSFQYYFHHSVTMKKQKKKKIVFSTYYYYVHYATILTKSIVLLLLLRSLRHDCEKKNKLFGSNYFSFQQHFHYTIIMKLKYGFAIATTFTTP